MKSLAFLLVLANFAAEATASGEYGALAPWASTSALAVVCGLLVWSITVGNVKAAREHREERKEWRDSMERRDMALTESMQTFARALEGLTVNCASRAEQYRHDKG